MTPLAAIAATGELFANARLWGAVVCLALGLALLAPRTGRRRRAAGAVLAAVGAGLLFSFLIPLTSLATAVMFWLLAAITLLAALGTISMTSPVYSAIWFAVSLLGVAGLMMVQGAQFLGVATVAVYAGAIVVTFLFVIMLAQPAGQATYDCLSWGRFAGWSAAGAGALLVGILTVAIAGTRRDAIYEEVFQALAEVTDAQGAPLIAPGDVREVKIDFIDFGGGFPREPQLIVGLSPSARKLSAEAEHEIMLHLANRLTQSDAPELYELSYRLFELLPQHEFEFEAADDLFGSPLRQAIQIVPARDDLLAEHHVAHLGAQLFGRHLVAIEAAGALLLAALVGAVAIAVHGRDLQVRGVPEQEAPQADRRGASL